MKEIHRLLEDKVVDSLQAFPAVYIAGPRQSGKTTLAKLEPYEIIEEKKLPQFQYDYFIQALYLGRGWLENKSTQSGHIRHVIRVSARNRQTLLIDPQNSNYPVAVALEIGN